jgi:hypothetical protein
MGSERREAPIVIPAQAGIPASKRHGGSPRDPGPFDAACGVAQDRLRRGDGLWGPS